MQAYIEQDCTIEHEGRKYTSGGAVVSPDYIVAYLGKRLPTGERSLTDWHGHTLGTYRITSTWKTPGSFVSSTMSQVYARVNGVTYTGRSAGEGMVFKGKRCK